MKTSKIMAIAAAVVALAACTKEQGNCDVATFKKGQEVTLNVTADMPATKVTSELNGTSVDFKWQADDKILVTVDSKTAEFTLASGAGDASATFTGTMPADGSTFDVQYPVTDPVLTTQAYSSSEAIPHDMMKFAATNCSVDSPTFSLTPQFAALRLNFYGTDQNVSKINLLVMDASTYDMYSYTLNFSGGVTLSTDSSNPTPFFFVVPAGDMYFQAEVFPYYVEGAVVAPESDVIIKERFTVNGGTNTFTTSSAKTLTAGQILNMDATETTVSAPTKVYFSKGNLQATCSTSTSSYSWGFAANQWDYIGNAAGNTTIDSQTDGAVVDLFGWVGASSTALTGDFTKYGISTSTTASDYGNSTSDALKADWSDISTLPQVTCRKWHTLSKDEWTYLLSTREVTVGGESQSSYGEGSVNGVNGLIILPDNWDGSVFSGFTYGSSSWSNTFTESTTPKWSDMETAGCVFLPAAGNRYGSSLSCVGSYGNYWSSTPYSSRSDSAYYLSFSSGNVRPAVSSRRVYGQSVRLVSVAQ